MKKESPSFSLDDRFKSLGEKFWVPVTPVGLINPIEVKRNEAVAAMLGFQEGSFSDVAHESFENIFSGNALLQGYEPIAQQYAGHQYGNFNPFLGDGRSAIIGEIATVNSSPYDYWQLSIKGIGATPFAFNGDGYAGLNECLHEYDCSQRLSELNVPTAFGLCVMQGEKQVYRRGLKGGSFKDSAMLTRVAPSFVRFGTFELFYFQRNVTALRALADHIIYCYYPESEALGEKKYADFFKQVVINTAQLIAHWQAVGFVHGMMNTDNQSILGITLDFGSSAFTNDFDDDFVSAASDEHGRYAFGQQPMVGLWNCNVLAKALSPIIVAEDLKQGLLCYETSYLEHYEMLAS